MLVAVVSCWYFIPTVVVAVQPEVPGPPQGSLLPTAVLLAPPHRHLSVSRCEWPWWWHRALALNYLPLLLLLTPPPLSPSLIFLPFCSVLHSLPAFLPFPTCIPSSPSDPSLLSPLLSTVLDSYSWETFRTSSLPWTSQYSRTKKVRTGMLTW